MSLEELSKFLEKFKKFSIPNNSLRRIFKDVLKDNLKIEIEIGHISFDEKTGVLTLNTESNSKALVFINKENLINKTNQILGKDLLKNII